MRKKSPPTEEQSLFQQAMEGVTPLGQKKAKEKVQAAPKRVIKHTKSPPPAPPSAPWEPIGDFPEVPRVTRRPEEVLQQGLMGISQKQQRGLKQGTLPVERRLDCHGMRVAEAREAVYHFIMQAHSENKRCVCVVHGKGTQERPSPIKALLPEWLDGLPVVAYSSAPNHLGGTGALLILLRSNRG